MAYQGYLIKAGGSSGTIVPTKLMQPSAYKATPDQRMESKASRDATGYLNRTTVSNVATKIEFETTYITNRELTGLMAIFRANFTDALQRKITINYYDPETDSYRDAVCYMPDVDYTIYNVDNEKNIITYEPVRFAFIEYGHAFS